MRISDWDANYAKDIASRFNTLFQTSGWFFDQNANKLCWYNERAFAEVESLKSAARDSDNITPNLFNRGHNQLTGENFIWIECDLLLEGSQPVVDKRIQQYLECLEDVLSQQQGRPIADKLNVVFETDSWFFDSRLNILCCYDPHGREWLDILKSATHENDISPDLFKMGHDSETGKPFLWIECKVLLEGEPKIVDSRIQKYFRILQTESPCAHVGQ